MKAGSPRLTAANDSLNEKNGINASQRYDERHGASYYRPCAYSKLLFLGVAIAVELVLIAWSAALIKKDGGPHYPKECL